MTYFQALFLGIVQGLTEFLPISSSGHLVIAQKYFALEPPVLFDILVHVGTLGAILVFFKDRLRKLLTSKYLWLISWGTIPTIISGLFFLGYLEVIFDSTRLVAISLLVTAGLLFSTRLRETKKDQGLKNASNLKFLTALWVGFFQALAILPGISRSGATISAGLLVKLAPETAFEFSFLLAVPAILGALVTQIPSLSCSSEGILHGVLGMVVAGVVGWFCLQILQRVLISRKFWLFGFYCLGLGLLLLV